MSVNCISNSNSCLSSLDCANLDSARQRQNAAKRERARSLPNSKVSETAKIVNQPQKGHSPLKFTQPKRTQYHSQNFLHWTQRPDSLKDAISRAFNRIVGSYTSKWGAFNGNARYGLCDVDEQALLKKIIQQAPAGQKEFYVLDIGAGNFEWSESMAANIEKQADLPPDIKVHILGIRGESYFGDRVVETDHCKIYYLGAFKVEELFEQFKRAGFDLENKIDLAVSQWCFRHLADPLGTAAQVYHLLRSKTGFFLVDGFFFLCNDGRMTDGNIQMTRLFLDMKAPFLTQYVDNGHSLNHFMLRKPDDSPCRLPMSYLETYYPGDGWQIGSECVTGFRREPQKGDQEEFSLPSSDPSDYRNIYGDKKMYDWLKENGLLFRSDRIWKPLQEKDNALTTPPLHQAIEQDERDKIQIYLDRGDDINESDSLGQTPLHLACQRRSFELFKSFLDRGAQTELFNERRNTVLHEAALFDTEGHFLQALIHAGAKVDAKIYDTPLDRAIEVKNVKAVEILIKAGAKISEKNYNDLKDPVFISLCEEKMIKKPQKERKTRGGGLPDVCHFIQKGDCVVLHCNGNHAMTYFYPNASNKISNLIYMNINPKYNLLGDDEWPAFLRISGYEYKPYNVEEIKKLKFKKIKQFKFAYNF
jgi:hypothetical protein